eukprot:347676-Pleurochrysis_carterae.AAC.1
MLNGSLDVKTREACRGTCARMQAQEEAGRKKQTARERGSEGGKNSRPPKSLESATGSDPVKAAIR